MGSCLAGAARAIGLTGCRRVARASKSNKAIHLIRVSQYSAYRYSKYMNKQNKTFLKFRTAFLRTTARKGNYKKAKALCVIENV